MGGGLSLLIAEDERWEREGLFRLFDWGQLGIGQVTTAKDGVEGYEIAQSIPPDIVIFDIKMPGMDGIEMLKKIVSIQPNVKAIILSGYSEFQYARDALRLGVFEYVLKPVDPEELGDVLRRVIGLCLREREERGSRCDRARYFFLQLLSGSEDESVLRLQMAELGYPLKEGGTLAVMRCDSHAPYASLIDALDQAGRVALYFPPNQMPSLPPGRAAGISSVGSGEGALRNAYLQAVKAMEQAVFLGVDSPVEYEAATGSSAATPLEENEQGRALEWALSTLDEQSARAAWASIIRYIDANKKAGRQAISNLLYTLVNAAYRALHREQPANAPGGPLLSMETLQELLAFASDEMEKLFADIARKRSGTDGLAVAKAVRLIHERYMTDLSVKSLASSVFLSPNYLGALFKRHTGKTISEYLCAHRMERALQLLRGGEMQISAVARVVGIRNTSYFCALFKQAFGMTPKEYQEANR